MIQPLKTGIEVVFDKEEGRVAQEIKVRHEKLCKLNLKYKRRCLSEEGVKVDIGNKTIYVIQEEENS